MYTGVLHRHTPSQNRTLLVLLLSLVTMSSSAPSTRQSHPPPVRKGAHASVSTISKPGYARDTRRLALLTYFRACSCPAAKWASTFIREADRNELDWRLVASIAMVESTGGKHYRNRNILGWGSAQQRFPSEQAGIQYVSSRLHSSPLYTRKSLNQMLLTYNSERRNYVTLVTEVMRQLTVVKSELEAQQAAIAAAEQPSSKLQRGHSYFAGKGDIFILP